MAKADALEHGDELGPALPLPVHADEQHVLAARASVAIGREGMRAFDPRPRT